MIPKSCETCVKVDACKMYESLSGVKQEFNSRYGDLVSFTFDVRDLAKSCNLYLSPVKNEKVEVTVAKQFLLNELKEAKLADDELRQVEIQRVLGEMYQVNDEEVVKLI